MKMFEPILTPQSITYALTRAQFYRNAAREKKWGSPVYFTPSTWEYDRYGQAGPGYEYGKPYDISQGYYGNCTWWVMGRYHEISGIVLESCVGDADDVFRKYNGRKTGGNFNGQFLSDVIQPGDILVWADNTALSGAGHVNIVETTDSEYAYISESAYSKNKLYKGNACITYKLKLKDLITGSRVTLRPESPYSEICYGVIHTGDVFDKEEPDTMSKIKEHANAIIELCK